MCCGMLAGLPGGRESDGKWSGYTPDASHLGDRFKEYESSVPSYIPFVK
jgi:hypothetical protein